jgi:hypothetical protein
MEREDFEAGLLVTTTHVKVDEEGGRVHLILDPVGGSPYSSVYSPAEARDLASLLTAAADSLS